MAVNKIKTFLFILITMSILVLVGFVFQYKYNDKVASSQGHRLLEDFFKKQMQAKKLKGSFEQIINNLDLKIIPQASLLVSTGQSVMGVHCEKCHISPGSFYVMFVMLSNEKAYTLVLDNHGNYEEVIKD
ncbi:hypothetical protein ACJVC5_16365 [Peredibacter sp. HCB2-198]|uniref:hypothetical protein n=1 Tax=Peredibacter sp. HCB2-198 TaxID=3383025 RepID=UPI0038B5499B